MDRLKVAKRVASAVTTYGSGIIARSIIANNVSVTRLDKKIAVNVAAFAIGSAISEIACREIDGYIKLYVDIYRKTRAAQTESPDLKVVKDDIPS